VNRCVGLDEALEWQDLEIGALERADDARGDRLAQAEGIADREDPLTNARAVRVAQPQRSKALGVDFDQREIARRVRMEDGSLQLAVVVQPHPDPLGVPHEVVVRQDVAVGVDDEA
jgi:hypothetical protein